MARIKDESVEAVKAAANIVELVETRTRLRKVGGRYTGLCPFHEEKTPSFSVSPDRGTYHCFGCGVGGDSISFVRETEGVDFVGAIEWLADRFHVELQYDESSPQADAQRRKRDRLYALLEQAAVFYERTLWESEHGAQARAYLESRALGADVAREFRLGLSPAGATLARKAAEKGYTRDELAATGLVTRRGNDYFQRRLMFPLTDARARVIGFQARNRDLDARRGDPRPLRSGGLRLLLLRLWLRLLLRLLMSCGDERITLPPAEMQLMLAFVRSGGQVVRRSLLESAAWGLSDAVTPNALDVALHRLRRKLQAIGSRQRIVNIRTLGYALRETALAE